MQTKESIMANENFDFMDFKSFHPRLLSSINSCNCKISSPSQSATTTYYSLTPKHPIEIQFSKKWGLINIKNHAKKTPTSDIYSQILTLDKYPSFHSYENFFKENGYLFTLSEQKNISELDIKKSCHFLATLIHLTSALRATTINYNLVLYYLIDLLYTDEQILRNLNPTFHTPLISNYLVNPADYGKGIYAETHNLQAWIDISTFYYKASYLTIYDTFKKDEISIPSKNIFNTSTHVCPENVITLLYFSNFLHQDILSKKTVDFLEHLSSLIPQQTLYKNENLLSLKLTPAETPFLSELAYEYIEYYLKQVSTHLSIELSFKSSPNIQIHVPDLFSLCIIGLLALDANHLVHQVCANDSCGKYFITTQHNTKRNYCCTSCQGNAKAKRYRERKKRTSGGEKTIS